MSKTPIALVTGATGYIGGRLVPRLLNAGYRVRCLARDPRKLADRSWAADPGVEIVTGNAADSHSLTRAMRGCQVAFYMIHSMIAAGRDYRTIDRKLADGFAECAERSGVERIIYLGGLGETGPGLSDHLRSRREVEHALAARSVPVTVFRAAMIIGSGSASFEILRYLVERLPVMVTPKWVHTRSQPIAVQQVLHYLVDCLRRPETIGRTFDIGGPDVLSYREIMQTMAECLGLRRRLIIPVPVLTPRLSSLWIHLVTPIDRRIARPLAEGLRNPVICRNDDAARLMPGIRVSVRDAILSAIESDRAGRYETVWSGAGAMPGDPEWAGGKVFVDRREMVVEASATQAFGAICRIGGGHGWYAADWLWRARGAIDRLFGGPGLRRLRRSPETVAYGESLDFWRVTSVEPGSRLALRAEMKLPGTALLEFRIQKLENERLVRIVQTARFKPRGLLGLVYWYSVLPLHGLVFRGMLGGIRRAAEALAAETAPVTGSEPVVEHALEESGVTR